MKICWEQKWLNYQFTLNEWPFKVNMLKCIYLRVTHINRWLYLLVFPICFQFLLKLQIKNSSWNWLEKFPITFLQFHCFNFTLKVKIQCFTLTRNETINFLKCSFSYYWRWIDLHDKGKLNQYNDNITRELISKCFKFHSDHGGNWNFKVR